MDLAKSSSVWHAALLLGALAAAPGWMAAQNSTPKAAPGAARKASPQEIQKHIDREWVKNALIHDMLDHWREASVMPSGFIQENLDRQWKPWGTQREASLNGQGRMLYTFTEAYKITKDPRYLDAITRSADFLLKMHDDQYGGYFNRVSPDFKVIDDSKTFYSSFAVFSLAHAYIATRDPKYQTAALSAWHDLRDKMRDGHFFEMTMKRDYSGPAVMNIGGRGRSESAAKNTGSAGARPSAVRQHSVNEHLFECLLGLYEATHSPEVWNEIKDEMNEIAKLYNYELGYLPDSYDDNWKPIPPASLNVGHLFEWATLFSKAVELGGDPKFIEMGNRSIDLGIKVGFSKNDGAVWMSAKPDGEIPRKYMIWWAECET